MDHRRLHSGWGLRWSVLVVVATLAAVMSGCAPVEVADGPGAQTYLRYCYSCHAAGIAGAPRVGRSDQWAPRAATGLENLVQRTVSGIDPGMPPMGGCRECSQADLRAAIEHMLAASGLRYRSDGTVEALGEEELVP